MEKILPIIKKKYGTLAWQIMDLLYQHHAQGKRISENKIAKLLNVDVHDVRKVLYLFQNQGVVFSRFWKINKKGWQINSWHINEDNLHKLLDESKNEGEINYSYYCPICGRKFTEEEALTENYMCNSCGEVLQQIENYEINIKVNDNNKVLMEELDY